MNCAEKKKERRKEKMGKKLMVADVSTTEMIYDPAF